MSSVDVYFPGLLRTVALLSYSVFDITILKRNFGTHSKMWLVKHTPWLSQMEPFAANTVNSRVPCENGRANIPDWFTDTSAAVLSRHLTIHDETWTAQNQVFLELFCEKQFSVIASPVKALSRGFFCGFLVVAFPISWRRLLFLPLSLSFITMCEYDIRGRS